VDSSETVPHERLGGAAGDAAMEDAGRQAARVGRTPVSGWKQLQRVAERLIVPAAFVALWFGLTEGHVVGTIFLPPPQAVGSIAQSLGTDLLRALGVSLQMVFFGFLIGGVAGIGVGLLFGYSRLARNLFEFTLDTVRPIPLFALIPLFILWFGIGKRPQIALVALGVFLILSLATIEAVRNVPEIYVRAALTCGASRLQAYRTVVIPAITPHLIGAVRFAAVAAWGLDVAAEYTGSQNGLGYIMIVRQQYLDTAGITLIVLIFCILAIFVDFLIRRVGRHLTRWTSRSSDSGLVGEMLGGA
jgi:ABC-type nitrate/sulfonate/bicarbonate transport system permease component